MDKFLQELSAITSDNCNEYMDVKLCNCVKIYFYDFENANIHDKLNNKCIEIRIYDNLNCDLDVNCIVSLEEYGAIITNSVKCHTFSSYQIKSNIVDWTNITAFCLEIYQQDINYIINNAIIMESVRVLVITDLIEIDLLQYSFPNCILLDFYNCELTMETINLYVNNDYIFYFKRGYYLLDNYLYKDIFSKFYLYSYPIKFANYDEIEIYDEIAKIPMRKFKMCKNANFT
jgi:hypothetical protein